MKFEMLLSKYLCDCLADLDLSLFHYLGNLVTPQDKAEYHATKGNLEIRWHEVCKSDQPCIVRASQRLVHEGTNSTAWNKMQVRKLFHHRHNLKSHNIKKRLLALRFQYIPDIILLYCVGVYESAAVPRAGQAVEDLQCIHSDIVSKS